jgi:hypothetical protein
MLRRKRSLNNQPRAQAKVCASSFQFGGFMSDYPARPVPEKQEVKDAECCEAGYVTKEAKKQAGSNWSNLVDESKVLDHPLEIPKTDCSK